MKCTRCEKEHTPFREPWKFGSEKPNAQPQDQQHRRRVKKIVNRDPTRVVVEQVAKKMLGRFTSWPIQIPTKVKKATKRQEVKRNVGCQ